MAATKRALEAGAANDPDAESALRTAIERLVDAFLIDRTGNRDCFARAHALGRKANRRFGCEISFEPEHDGYLNQCGVIALHSRLALSPGGTTTGRCSICEAPDFSCDHVPSRTYDESQCHRVITDWNVDEISLVQKPHDPRCYKVFAAQSKSDVEKVLGLEIEEGEPAPCNHCLRCRGRYGPDAEDLDPSSWPELPME